jgi:hypothetical protein
MTDRHLPRPRDHDGAAPDATVPDAADLPQGWVALGERRWWTPWTGLQSLPLVLIAVNLVNMSWSLTRLTDLPFAVALAVALAVPLVSIVVVIVVLARRWPLGSVSLGSDALRAGAHTVALASVDAARIGVVRRRRRAPIVTLRLSAGTGMRAEVVLRDHRGRTSDAEQRLVLAEALRRSSVAVPVSPDDPTGRFTRLNFPAHLERDAAVAMALRPEDADVHLRPRRLYQR